MMFSACSNPLILSMLSRSVYQVLMRSDRALVGGFHEADFAELTVLALAASRENSNLLTQIFVVACGH